EVEEIEKVITFYKTFLGFEEEIDKVEFEGEKIVFLKLGGFRMELIQRSNSQRIPDQVHLCFETDHLETIIDRLSNFGMTKIEGPFELENNLRTVFYRGPAFEILEFLEKIKTKNSKSLNHSLSDLKNKS
ncbi:MAG: VOC family protein, partial [Bacillota bacterium]|nr:VOC family protein [Bacillota bacterium]